MFPSRHHRFRRSRLMMNSPPANGGNAPTTLVISVTFASVKGTPDCQEIQSVTLRGSTSLNAEHRSGDARMSVHRNSGKRSCRFTTLFASKYGDANDEGNACSTSSFAIFRWILDINPPRCSGFPRRDGNSQRHVFIGQTLLEKSKVTRLWQLLK